MRIFLQKAAILDIRHLIQGEEGTPIYFSGDGGGGGDGEMVDGRGGGAGVQRGGENSWYNCNHITSRKRVDISI
jgi:hypothetical protein